VQEDLVQVSWPGWAPFEAKPTSVPQGRLPTRHAGSDGLAENAGALSRQSSQTAANRRQALPVQTPCFLPSPTR
jgi:hypothetical protein